MVGFLQIIIYLLAIYLVYKGIEIFQIAFMSPRDAGITRQIGVLIGGILIIGAIAIGVGAVIMSEAQAKSMSDSMNNVPKLR